MQDYNLIPPKQDNELQKVPEKRTCALQIPAAISVCLVRLGLGAVTLWTSPAVPYLNSSHPKFRITNDEASWIIALAPFGAVLGIFLYPLFINRIGRKHTLLLFAIFQVFSWLLLYYASNIYHIYFSRILAGIGYFAGFVLEIIYVGEVAEKKIRGFLVVLGKISFALGSLIVVLLGAFVSYDNMNLILLLISLLFVFTFPFMPETPYFYLMINREEDAFQSLVKLRGTRNIKLLQLEIDSIKNGMRHNFSKTYSLKKLFCLKRNRRAFLISSLLTLSVSFSGVFTVGTYMQTIVSYSKIQLKPEYSTTVIMLVMVILSVLIAPMPDWLGRRILTLIYGILTALGSAILGILFFCKFYLKIEDLSSFSWIWLVVFTVYIASCNLGLFCISNILMSEIFSVEVKSLATAIINIISMSLEFLLRLGFERAIGVFEIYGVFWIFSVLTFITTLISFIIMPETKGKTLEEIQEILETMRMFRS